MLDHDETFQAYSSFTTNYKSPADYEKLLVSASKTRGHAIRSWERREPFESALVRPFGASALSVAKALFSDNLHRFKTTAPASLANGELSVSILSLRAEYTNEPLPMVLREDSKARLGRKKR